MTLLGILAKDLQREWRSKSAISALWAIGVLFLVTFMFAFQELAGRHDVVAAVIWIPILYAGITACGRSFALETDAQVLDLLRAAPVPLGMHGLARTVVNVGLVATAAAAMTVLSSAFWNTSLDVLPLVLLGSVGIAVVATMIGGISSHARSRETLLPLLSIPILVPLLQEGMAGTVALLEGGSWSLHAALMTGYNFIAIGVAWILWPIILEGE